MKNTETGNTDLKTKLIQDFQAFENSLNGEAGSSVHKIRKDAIKKFEFLGFPEKKMEEWKYTNLIPVLKHDYKNSVTGYTLSLTESDIKDFLIKDKDVNLIVMVNGQFDNRLSKIVTKNDRIFIGSFSEGMKKFGSVIESHFSKYVDFSSNGLAALNTAFAKDGCFIYADKNVEITEPVHILNITDAREDVYFSQIRNLIVAEDGAKLRVIEDYHSVGDRYSFTNAVTEIFCEVNSDVEHYKIQNEGENAYHTGTTQVHQINDSRFSNTTISWGGAITRNDLNSVFEGTNTECHFYGLYLLTGKQHVDNHTFADHKSPNCYSNELYKGILDDHSTGVFNGKIMVRQDAQKTNAYQSNNNILISDDSTVYSKPQLEIFADDVKCSHGATSGQLNEDEMFYLQSRGIGRDNARILLLYAFASDVIDSIRTEELREKIIQKLEKKLRKEI